MNQYPELEEIEFYHVNLTAGDCLYIPLKWMRHYRSFGRNLAVDFAFNHEKLFDNKDFSDECAANPINPKKTLDKFSYNSSLNDYYENFKHFIMRQANLGVRSVEDWIGFLVSSFNIFFFNLRYMYTYIGFTINRKPTGSENRQFLIS